MPTIDEAYEATDPASIPDALSEAATQIRKAFQDRAEKHGAEDPEVIRLMAAHKAIIQLRKDHDTPENND